MTGASGAQPGRGDPGRPEHVPAVSVCVPLYMKERFVARTVQSVLDQTFGDFELVVVHNASPDRSGEVVRSFDDSRIRVVDNAETVPGPENVARAVGLARAPLVKILAADDVLYPTVLARQVAALADPGVAVVSCRQHMIDEDDRVLYPDRSLRHGDLVGRRDRRTVVRRVVRHTGNPLGAYANLMFRRADYEAIGGVPADAPWIAHDLALTLALLQRGDFVGLDETLVGFRIGSGSSSAAQSSEGIADQVGFTRRLRRDERADLRASDLVASHLRMPLMRVRHRLIVAAAGPRDDTRTRVARQVLGLSRPHA
ncbi:glycosyltransferase [Nocardioides flavescens]|uniref:Glycosyltransferase n=1 Tax=Nocardioides flavescens TaxID=2691959 RepID=A0A6L7ER50_9ACTN|nr:glycosyltransferase [Nocardioides flavescens]